MWLGYLAPCGEVTKAVARLLRYCGEGSKSVARLPVARLPVTMNPHPVAETLIRWVCCRITVLLITAGSGHLIVTVI